MKSIIIALALVACAYAADDVTAEVKAYSFDTKPEGDFTYNYETSNGISAQVVGHVEQLGKDETALHVSGSSYYTSPEGEKIEIKFTADENGYHAEGAHLPTPPPPQPIPEYIARSLEYIAAHPYVEKP